MHTRIKEARSKWRGKFLNFSRCDGASQPLDHNDLEVTDAQGSSALELAHATAGTCYSCHTLELTHARAATCGRPHGCKRRSCAGNDSDFVPTCPTGHAHRQKRGGGRGRRRAHFRKSLAAPCTLHRRTRRAYSLFQSLPSHKLPHLHLVTFTLVCVRCVCVCARVCVRACVHAC